MDHTKNRGADTSPVEGLPDLFARLASDVSSLVETKIGLLKVEIKEDIEEYARQSLLMGLGWVMAISGFALLSAGLALFLSSLFMGARIDPSVAYGMGFLALAVLDLLIGFVLIVKVARRMGLSRIWPERTVKQLQKDKRLIQKQL